MIEEEIEPGAVFGKYRKIVTAVVGILIGFAIIVTSSETPGVTPGEWIAGAVLAGTAFGVYAIPNKVPNNPSTTSP